MRLEEKINLKKYFLFMGGSALLALYFTSGWREVLAVLLAYVGIVLNHLFHLYASAAMLNLESDQKGRAVVFMLLKTIILAIFLIISIQMMEKKIFIPVIIYLFMLMVFTLSLKKASSPTEGTKE